MYSSKEEEYFQPCDDDPFPCELFSNPNISEDEEANTTISKI
jgi:hypothetical protein